MYLQKLVNSIKDRPLEAFLGVCVAALIIFGASIKDVASTTLALFTLYGLSKVYYWKTTWRSLEAIEKAMFIAFIFYVLSGVLSYVNVEDNHEYVKQMDRYLRFAFLVPVALALMYSKFDFKKYFYIGVVLSGPAYFYFALVSSLEHPDWPAGGAYHHITFGGAATLSALLMMLMIVLEPWKVRWKALIMVSILCSLYASVLSQARGAWIAIPLGMLIILFALIKYGRFKASHAAIIFFVIVAGIFATPAGNIMEQRYTEAVNEVKLFIDSGDATTSIGGRLALWDLSIQIWKLSPLLGTGPGDFDNDLRVYQENNIYKDMAVHNSVHNIYLQALASTGLIGFLALLLALVILPLWYFSGYIKNGDKFGYYGFMVISAYTVFGLTESWVLRAPAVSIYIVYFIVILLACRYKEEKY